MKRLKPLLYAVPAYEYLRTAVQRRTKFPLGRIEREVFPDGEHYQRVVDDVSGRDVILIGGTISADVTLDIYDLACAMVKYGAHSLTLVIPYFGYSTMERAVKPGEVVVAKTRARLLSSIPPSPFGNRVVMVDLHATGLPHYFEGAVRPVHLYAKDTTIKMARHFGGKHFVLASTDAGRAKWVESLASEMDVPTAFVYKRRISGEKTEITGVSATVKGRRVVVYDDMIRTGGSLRQAARAYRQAGASAVYAVATHGVFPGDAFARIHASGLLDGIGCTDSHPNVLKLPPKDIRVESIATLVSDYLAST